jgi:hypothetical protein
MTVEIERLTEQLSTLKILYEDAILNDSPKEYKARINQQIEMLEQLIADRKKLTNRNHQNGN